MLGTEYPFADCQSTLVQQSRSCKIAFGRKTRGETGQFVCRLPVLGTKRVFVFVDCQCAFVEWPCSRKIAVVLKTKGEILQTISRKPIMGAKHFFTEC